jgi:hypothetical protein
MPLFYNRAEKYCIITNYKVMYGTLCRQDNLRLIPNKISPLFILASRFNLLVKEINLLVRNPYDKLVSFYMHKILYNKFQDKKKAKSYRDLKWQDCQKILFPYLALSSTDDDYTIAKKLASMTFDDFIQVLPTIYKRDAHLWPQIWAYNVRWKGFPLMRYKVSHVIPIEQNLNILKNKLKLNINIRANKTKRQDYNTYFTPKSYEIAYRVYKKDFDAFGYDQNT